MKSYKKLHIAALVIFCVYYLLWCFVAGTFSLWTADVGIRISIVLFLVIPAFIATMNYTYPPEFLAPISKSEEISKAKQYSGELKEELEILQETQKIHERIREFKKRNNL